MFVCDMAVRMESVASPQMVGSIIVNGRMRES